jgi:hypothetical protein
MVEVKRDILGRRIPEFDREAANRKAQQTREERHGTDFNKRIAPSGGRHRGRGYFGYLRDTDPEKLRDITSAAGQKSAKTRSKKRNTNKRNTVSGDTNK